MAATTTSQEPGFKTLTLAKTASRNVPDRGDTIPKQFPQKSTFVDLVRKVCILSQR
jgi:hypothetical protein